MTEELSALLRASRKSAGWSQAYVGRRLGVTSHQFRRGATNRLLGQGGPLGDVMSQLGHESPTMTLLYGRAERQERAIATFHALDQGVRRINR